MHQHEMPKLYTVEEARALIPRLRALLSAMQAEKQQFDAEAEALERLAPAMRQNGHATTASTHERRMTKLLGALQAKLDQLTELDIEVKDLNTGLVDFLSLRDGRVVYLCWQVDEPTIAYWHEIDTGFAGRQPLDE